MAKILIVEDDIFFSGYLSEFLMDLNIQSTLARDAGEALRENTQSYDAIIIDVMIPNDPDTTGISLMESRGNYLAGVALARRFKETNPGIPIVFLSSDVTGSEAKDWAYRNNAEYILKSDGLDLVYKALVKYKLLPARKLKSFIVHGQDEKSLLELKNYLQNTLGFDEPIVLREQKSCGKTIIDKFEYHAKVIDLVFVLLTPDDVAIDVSAPDELKRKARQNVIFELGYFYGLLGRESGKIIVLHKGPIELPSDIQGIIWIDISGGIVAAGELIRKEVMD